MTEQNEEVVTQAADSATELDSAATGDNAASTDTSANVAASPADADKSSAPKTALEAVTAGIEDGQKPRRITSKAEDDGRPRNEDGTFKAETAEEKAARERAELIAKETPAEKTAREAKEAADAKKPDHVNDPIDPSLKGRTAERMKYLIDTVKQQAGLMESHTALFDAVQGTGASPDEFATMIHYMKAVHANDIPTLERAYTMLQAELKGLSIKLGKPIPEVNLLRDPTNADLVKEIQEGKITNARAHELAVARAQRTKATTETSTADAQKKAQQEFETAKAAAITALDKLDGTLRARDGNEAFQAKYDVIVPMLKKLYPRIDPKEWVGVFQQHYDNMPTPVKPAVVVPPKTMPLRPKTPAGGNASAAPKSALEAINAALEG